MLSSKKKKEIEEMKKATEPAAAPKDKKQLNVVTNKMMNKLESLVRIR